MIKCVLCNHESSTYNGLGIHIKMTHHLSTKEYYDLFMKQPGEGICPVDGKETPFLKLSKGYQKHCCAKCAQLNLITREKIKETNLERYGEETPLKLDCVREKTNESIWTDKIREKRKQTNLKRYDVEYPSQSKEIKEKIKQTKLERYGVENYNNCEKAKETNLERYGVEFIFQLNDVHEKGTQYAWSNDAREKREQTNLKKYGTKNVYQSNHAKEKSKQTKLERYGNENYNNNEKYKQTCIERYGIDCALNTHESRQKALQTMRKNGNRSSLETMLEQFFIDNNIKYEQEYDLDPRYPFHCDFYLPDSDTFIEINGFWTHGGHWFDEDNKDDRNILDTWIKKYKEGHEQYKSAIQVWTIKDPQKRNIAIKNKLNYVVLWTYNDIIDFINTLSQQ